MDNDNFYIAGKNAVLEYLHTTPEKVDIVYIMDKMRKNKSTLLNNCKEKNVKYQFVPEKKLSQFTDLKHQGVVARIFSPGFLEEEDLFSKLQVSDLPLILAFDQIQDSGNVGTLARTLYSLGGTGIVITKDRSAFMGDRAFKTSAGAISHVPITRVTNLARFLRQCQEKELIIYYAANDRTSRDLYLSDLQLPAILVLGNENKGVRPGVAKEGNLGLRIPQQENFDSLNVAQAGAIIVGELLRQYRFNVHTK